MPAKGLRVRAALDTDEYPIGVKVDDAVMAALRLTPDEFHGEWNYAITPADQARLRKQSRKLRAGQASEPKGNAFNSALDSRHCGQCRFRSSKKRSLWLGSIRWANSCTTTYSNRSLGFFTSSVFSRMWPLPGLQLPHLVFMRCRK